MPVEGLAGEVALNREVVVEERERLRDARLEVRLQERAGNLKNTKLRWFSRCGQFTRIGHILGGGRPLLKEGGPISYMARPSGVFQPLSSNTLKARLFKVPPIPKPQQTPNTFRVIPWTLELSRLNLI